MTQLEAEDGSGEERIMPPVDNNQLTQKNMKHSSLPPKANSLATYHSGTAPNLQLAGFAGGVSGEDDEAEKEPSNHICAGLTIGFVCILSAPRCDSTDLRLDDETAKRTVIGGQLPFSGEINIHSKTLSSHPETQIILS